MKKTEEKKPACTYGVYLDLVIGSRVECRERATYCSYYVNRATPPRSITVRGENKLIRQRTENTSKKVV